MSGLFLRGKTWHFRKRVSVPERFAINPLRAHINLSGTTKMKDKESAERIFRLAIQQAEDELLYGKRKNWTLNDAIPKYLQTRKRGKSMNEGVRYTEVLAGYMGDMPLKFIHQDCGEVKRLIDDFKVKGSANATINHYLKVLRNILNLAHRKWRDGDLSWIESPGFIGMLPTDDEAPPHVLTLGQARELFAKLPPDLFTAVTLALHTGLRDASLCAMRWDHAVMIPELNTMVFDLPKGHPGLGKSGQSHRVVLNSLAHETVLELEKRSQESDYVVTYQHGYKFKPYGTLNTTSWKKAVADAGLNDCRGEGKHFRIHDLRHTFGTRLRTQGIGKEDRKDLLGHKRGKDDDITTHYSGAETGHLIQCAEELVEWYDRKAPSVYVRNALQGRGATVVQLPVRA